MQGSLGIVNVDDQAVGGDFGGVAAQFLGSVVRIPAPNPDLEPGIERALGHRFQLSQTAEFGKPLERGSGTIMERIVESAHGASLVTREQHERAAVSAAHPEQVFKADQGERKDLDALASRLWPRLGIPAQRRLQGMAARMAPRSIGGQKAGFLGQ